MKILDQYLEVIKQAEGLDAKKEAMIEMINQSHAKARTKQKALNYVQYVSNENRLLAFAYNFALSGEGYKVI